MNTYHELLFVLDVSMILWCLLVLSLDAVSDNHEVSLDVECNFKVCFYSPTQWIGVLYPTEL